MGRLYRCSYEACRPCSRFRHSTRSALRTIPQGCQYVIVSIEKCARSRKIQGYLPRFLQMLRLTDDGTHLERKHGVSEDVVMPGIQEVRTLFLTSSFRRRSWLIFTPPDLEPVYPAAACRRHRGARLGGVRRVQGPCSQDERRVSGPA